MDSNRYAPPKAAVEDIAAQHTSADISSLAVSDNWKAKFYLLEKPVASRWPASRR